MTADDHLHAKSGTLQGTARLDPNGGDRSHAKPEPCVSDCRYLPFQAPALRDRLKTAAGPQELKV